MYEKSAYRSLVSAVVALLKRDGVNVGGTSGYPRVEVHSVTENELLDKGGNLRRLSLTVESISAKSKDEACTMNEVDIERMTADDAIDISSSNFRCVAVSPTQLQDMTESSDTQETVYRMLQAFDIWVEKI